MSSVIKGVLGVAMMIVGLIILYAVFFHSAVINGKGLVFAFPFVIYGGYSIWKYLILGEE